MHVPPLLISQTFGQISIAQDPGHVEIEQPRAKVNIEQNLPQVQISTTDSELHIDQSAAMAAYGSVSAQEMNDRIYAQIPQVVEEIIAKTVQDGRRMADIHVSTEVIPDLAKERPRERTEFDYHGEASIDNVDIDYIPGELHQEVDGGEVLVHVEPQPPIFHYQPAQVHIGMLQYPSLEIEWSGRLIDQVL